MASKPTRNIGFRLCLEKDVDILAFFDNLHKSEKLAVFREAMRNHMRGFAPQVDITHDDIMGELATLRGMLQGVTLATGELIDQIPEPEPNEHADLDAMLDGFGVV